MGRKHIDRIGVGKPYIADLSELSYASGTFHVVNVGWYSPQRKAYLGSIVSDYIYEETEVPEI